MLQSRQSALRLASRRLRNQTPRRFESSKAHDSHAGHDTHHAAPKNESFGSGLYVMIAGLPVGYFLYTQAQDGNNDGNWLANMIPDFKGQWEERNALHTAAVELAGQDRNLFVNAPHRQNVEMRFPEVFNTGSPFNQSSSNSVDLTAVMNHYKKKNAEQVEKTAKKTAEQKYAGSSP